MKKTMQTILICFVLGSGAYLPAAESWEGTDDFTSSARWYKWQKKGKNGEQGQLSLQAGTLIYSSSVPYPQGLAFASWLWGNPKKPTVLPTAANWKVQCTLEFPPTAPTSNIDVAVAGLCITLKQDTKAAMYGALRASYKNSSNALPDQLDFVRDLVVYPGANDGANVSSDPIGAGAGKFILSFLHDALKQQDTFAVTRYESPIEEQSARANFSSLSGYPSCQVGPFMMVGEKETWPGMTSNMSIRDWSVVAIDPEPIDLEVKSGTSGGVAYSVAVNGLDLVNQKLTGTVTLTVGTSTATLPISGSINKNGSFTLTAKGSKANGTSGFSCTLLYDSRFDQSQKPVGYWPRSNRITAPNQKAIKF